MENISKHISELLYFHDCVIVPGFGGLVANHVTAVYDEEKNMFSPPAKEIVFNTNLKHNDGLLISHIASAEGISYEKAGELVNDFVTDTLKALKNGKSVALNKIGEFSSDANGILTFTPDTNENFNTDAFGLSSFHFNPVVPYQRKTYKLKPAAQRAVRFKASHVAAGIAIVVGLFVFSPEVKNPSVNQAGGIELLMPENNTLEIPETEQAAMPEQTKAEEKPAVKPEVEVKLAAPEYFIIAGSFKKIDQAEKYSSIIRNKKDIEPLIIKSSNGRFRVAVNGFASKEEAVTALKSLRAHKEFKHAWVLHQK